MRRIKCEPHHPTAAASEQANTGHHVQGESMTRSTPARRAPRHTLIRAAAMLALVGLAGCSNFGANQYTYTCPESMTVPELQSLVRIAPGPNGAAVESAGRINSVNASCTKEGDNGVATRVDIEFTALRTTPTVTHLNLPYFVAMADSNGNILGKQLFSMGVDFGNTAPVAKTSDHITAHLPLKNPQLGNVYTVIVGFQLDQSQLDYNRAHLQ
jgi:hypothetical protein